MFIYIPHTSSQSIADKTEIDQLQTAINERKNQWLPELQSFIEKIAQSYSKFFQELGCAGDVKLEEHEVCMQCIRKKRGPGE